MKFNVSPIQRYSSRFTGHLSYTVIVLCSLFANILYADDLLWTQSPELRFEHFTVDEGLSHSQVSCMLQDSRGFMWIGTHEGLNKYDGYEFTVYKKDTDKPGSISGSMIRCLYEDKRKRLWIGTLNNGLNLYDRDSDSFAHFNTDSTSLIRIKSMQVNSILEDQMGNLWIGTANGIELLNLADKKSFNYLPFDSSEHPPGYNTINTMYEDKQGDLWIGTESGGLCLFNRRNLSFSYFQHHRGKKTSISDNTIRSIYEDNEAQIWIGTYNGGFNLLNRENMTFKHFFPDINVRESLTVKDILDDGKGNLWIGTRNGLYLFNKKSHRYRLYAYNPNDPSSLNQNNVQAIFRDTKGDFWFGTKEGLNLLNTTNLPFVHYRAEISNPLCLNHKVVHAIFEDSRGNLWFGTEEGGLNCFNRRAGRFSYYSHDPEDPTTISSNDVTEITQDSSGHLWIGTFQGGLNQFIYKKNQFRRFKLDPSKTLILQDPIYTLLVDREGELLIGSNGLYCFDKKKQKINRLPLDMKGYDDSFYALYQDSKGRIWAGCLDSYLHLIDTKTRTHKAMAIADQKEITRINVIREDRAHNLWIGTHGNGLYCLPEGDNLSVSFSTKNGLSSNYVMSIQYDTRGRLWMGTSRGLSCFDPRTNHFKNYYKENGLQANLFTFASCKTHAGELLFGGINGVTAFDPLEIKQNTFVPPVYITDIKIFNKSLKPDSNPKIMTEHINKAKKIELSYAQSVITFSFTALNFSNRQQNKFAYMMEGFEKDWNYVDAKKRFATYTNLDPGEYIFRVKAANDDDVWNDKGASLNLYISPPFWKSWWFKLLVMGLLFSIALFIFNYFKQKKNLLESTALANLSQLKLLRNQMNPHFLFNALGSIRSLIHINKGKAWQLVSELSEFFQYTLLNYNKLEVTLNEEIEAAKNYLNIEQIQFKKPLNISYHIDEAALDCIVPAFMLQPLVENALKYGLKQSSPENFCLNLTARYYDENLTIEISNTGKLAGPGSDDTDGIRVHGNSLKNIRGRLELIYNNDFKIDLFEEVGWVHVRILIHYKENKKSNGKQKKEVRTINLSV
jgi:ligand-binding sensor domain-containing protein